MKSWIVNNKLVLIGFVIGGIAGFLYWQQVGCDGGTCLITSRWLNSTAYGALLGILLFGLFKRTKNGNRQ